MIIATFSFDKALEKANDMSVIGGIETYLVKNDEGYFAIHKHGAPRLGRKNKIISVVNNSTVRPYRKHDG